MPHSHLTVQPRAEATVIAISAASLAAIDGQDGFGPMNEVKEQVLAELADAAGETRGGVIIDVRGAAYVGHASLNVVLRAARLLATRNRPRAICCSAAVKDVLDICRLDRLLGECPYGTNLDDAVAQVARPRGRND